MSKSFTNKRIVFRLSKNLKNLLDKKSRKLSTTKAKLIKKWISDINFSKFKTQKLTDEKNHSFNFYVNSTTYKRLENFSLHHKISISDLVCNIIASNVDNSQSKKNTYLETKNNISHLLTTGQYQELKHSLGTNIKNLDTESLLMYASSLIETSDFGLALILLDEAKILSHKSNSRFEVETIAYLLKCRINIIKYEITAAYTNLNYAFNIAMHLKNKLLIARCYLVKGILESLTSNVDSSINQYIMALDNLDINSHTHFAIEIYTRLSVSYNFKLESAKVYHYLKKAESLLQKKPNLVQEGTVYHHYSAVYLLNGDFKKALEYSNMAVIKKKQAGNIHKLVYTYEVQSMCHLLLNNMNGLKNSLNIADSLSNRARPERLLTVKNILKSIYEANFHSEKALNFLDYLKNTSEENHIKSDLYSYYYYAYHFVNSNSNLKEIAETGLKKISFEGKYPLIKNAAKKTLENKQLNYAC